MIRPPKYLMNAELEVEAYKGNTAYGPDYADLVYADAYVEPNKSKVTDTEGNEVVSKIMAVIRDEIEIPVQSKVTYNETEYEVIEATAYRPMGRFSHIEVYLR